MHVFKDFNKQYAGDILISTATYVLLLTAVFWGAYYYLDNPSSAVIFTLVVLLTAHLVRIMQISRSNRIALTKVQITVTVAAVIVVGLLATYAYVGSYRADLADVLALRIVFLPLLLASFFSIWIDFLVAHLLTKKS
jgi:hypothetical protein